MVCSLGFRSPRGTPKKSWALPYKRLPCAKIMFFCWFLLVKGSTSLTRLIFLQGHSKLQDVLGPNSSVGAGWLAPS